MVSRSVRHIKVERFEERGERSLIIRDLNSEILRNLGSSVSFDFLDTQPKCKNVRF